MADDVILLPMERRHVTAVEQIERCCFSRPWTREQLSETLDHPLSLFYVAVAGGEVAGYIGMYHVLEEGQITNVAVLPGFRGRGIAKLLISRVMREASARGMARLVLEVRKGNAPAIGVYRAMGFVENGMRSRFYSDPAEDALLMIRRIEG